MNKMRRKIMEIFKPRKFTLGQMSVNKLSGRKIVKLFSKNKYKTLRRLTLGFLILSVTIGTASSDLLFRGPRPCSLLEGDTYYGNLRITYQLNSTDDKKTEPVVATTENSSDTESDLEDRDDGIVAVKVWSVYTIASNGQEEWKINCVLKPDVVCPPPPRNVPESGMRCWCNKLPTIDDSFVEVDIFVTGKLRLNYSNMTIYATYNTKTQDCRGIIGTLPFVFRKIKANCRINTTINLVVLTQTYYTIDYRKEKDSLSLKICLGNFYTLSIVIIRLLINGKQDQKVAQVVGENDICLSYQYIPSAAGNSTSMMVIYEESNYCWRTGNFEIILTKAKKPNKQDNKKMITITSTIKTADKESSKSKDSGGTKRVEIDIGSLLVAMMMAAYSSFI